MTRGAMVTPLFLSILFHIRLGLGSSNVLINTEIVRREPVDGANGESISEPVQLDHESRGNIKVSVSPHGVGQLAQDNSHAEKKLGKRELPSRRGVLKAPTLREESGDHSATRASSVTRQRRPKDFSRKSATRVQSPKTRSKHSRRAAKTWRFRGPKPVSLLSDTRYTDAQKEKELERLMEKLHLEFFQKREMGHSRLAQAWTAFYKVVRDYKKLTGRDRPPDFHFEELPAIASSVAEIDEGGSEEYDDDDADDASVPDYMPQCMKGCQVTGHICYGDPNSWSADEACGCYRGWLACSMELCHADDRDKDMFFVALDTAEAEACAWPKSKLYKNLRMDKLQNRPANVTGEDEDADDTGALLQNDDDPHHGIHLVPLLETPLGGLSEMAVEEPSLTRQPSGCQVSHPEMLGDGNCDGGAYNTPECNYDGGDCCDVDCRPAHHRCGVGGYQCKGTRVAAKLGKNFRCTNGKLGQFQDFADLLRDELTLGRSMTSATCSQLTKEEHQQLSQAFNLGVELQWNEKVRSAAAALGGPAFFIDCDLWDNELGSEWFGTLVAHEMGHVAGYGHPVFTGAGMVFNSKCENIGSSYCHGHCKEWTTACQTHLVYGSKGCGFANTGCFTTCVHSSYCMAMPERATECLGYMKVHSRGESMSETANNALSKMGDTICGWLGCSGACQPRVALPLALAAAALLPLLADYGS